MEDNFSGIIFGRNIDNSYIEPIDTKIAWDKWEKLLISVHVWGNITKKYPTAMYSELSKLSN